MFFQTKKVKLETLPEYLKVARQQLKLSLNEASKNTGIAVSILKALEEGAYNQLPSRVYMRGFLSQLAEIYRIDKSLLIKQFEYEWQIHKAINQPSRLKPQTKKKFFDDWAITPKNLSLAAGAVFAGLTIIYIVWQVLAIGRAPVLEIESPQHLTVIEKSFVEIIGRTDPGATVTINDEAVFVENDGQFKTSVGLSAGPKELVVVAKNRFNKATSKTLTVIGHDRGSSDNQVQVRLELEFIGNAEISFRTDGGEEVKRLFNAGEKTLVEAKRQVLFSTNNAGRVRVKINGTVLGFLGREGEMLSDVPFFPESGNIK